MWLPQHIIKVHDNLIFPFSSLFTWSPLTPCNRITNPSTKLLQHFVVPFIVKVYTFSHRWKCYKEYLVYVLINIMGDEINRLSIIMLLPYKKQTLKIKTVNFIYLFIFHYFKPSNEIYGNCIFSCYNWYSVDKTKTHNSWLILNLELLIFKCMRICLYFYL